MLKTLANHSKKVSRSSAVTAICSLAFALAFYQAGIMFYKLLRFMLSGLPLSVLHDSHGIWRTAPSAMNELAHSGNGLPIYAFYRTAGALVSSGSWWLALLFNKRSPASSIRVALWCWLLIRCFQILIFRVLPRPCPRLASTTAEFPSATIWCLPPAQSENFQLGDRHRHFPLSFIGLLSGFGIGWLKF